MTRLVNPGLVRVHACLLDIVPVKVGGTVSDPVRESVYGQAV